MHCMNICLYDCYSMPKEIEMEETANVTGLLFLLWFIYSEPQTGLAP